MHKKAMDLAKKCLEEICLLKCPTDQEWCNFEKCLRGAAAAVALDKDYRLIEAMDKAEKEEELMTKIGTRMGYNNARYADGRYAPRGHGNYGYTPDEPETAPRMGFRFGGPDNMTNRYGTAYNGYRNARRGYRETNDPTKHKEMEDNMNDIFNDIEAMITDIAPDMDPQTKQRNKQRLQSIMAKIQ